MCVCMHACLYMCVCVLVCLSMHIHVHIGMSIRAWVYMYAHVRTSTLVIDRCFCYMTYYHHVLYFYENKRTS